MGPSKRRSMVTTGSDSPQPEIDACRRCYFHWLNSFNTRRSHRDRRMTKARIVYKPCLAMAWPSSARDDEGHALGGIVRILVLPHPHAQPASFCQELVGFPVPLHVSLKLGRPIVRVGSRLRGVFRALMPEATIDEYGHARRTEHQVGGATHSLDWAAGHSVAESSRVEEPAKCHFRSGVARAIRLHDPAASRRTRPRVAGRIRHARTRHARPNPVLLRDQCDSSARCGRRVAVGVLG